MDLDNFGYNSMNDLPEETDKSFIETDKADEENEELDSQSKNINSNIDDKVNESKPVDGDGLFGLALSDEAVKQRIVNDIFKGSGIKTTVDDPLIEWIIVNAKMINQAKEDLELTVKQQRADFVNEFDVRINNLERVLKVLEDQKNQIVHDVWKKSQDTIYKKTLENMDKAVNELVKKSNGEINNQRNFLFGGIGGLVVGLILGIIILLIVK